MEEQIRADLNNPNLLNTFAMLGNYLKEERKKNGVDLNKTFDQCMKEASGIEDPVKRVNTAMANYTLEILKTMPLENRCIYVLNKLNKAFMDKIDESQINWDKINEILFSSPLENDYNLCESVHTAEEVSHLLMSIRESYILGGPWYKKTCKTCGEEFYLTKDEITYFVTKGLHVPKRCKNCIMESKGQESYRQRQQREERERKAVRASFLPEDNRTAVQVAFDNAKKQKKGN